MYSSGNNEKIIHSPLDHYTGLYCQRPHMPHYSTPRIVKITRARTHEHCTITYALMLYVPGPLDSAPSLQAEAAVISRCGKASNNEAHVTMIDEFHRTASVHCVRYKVSSATAENSRNWIISALPSAHEYVKILYIYIKSFCACWRKKSYRLSGSWFFFFARLQSCVFTTGHACIYRV